MEKKGNAEAPRGMSPCDQYFGNGSSTHVRLDRLGLPGRVGLNLGHYPLFIFMDSGYPEGSGGLELLVLQDEG